MSSVRDRTEDFKEVVHVVALAHGYTESQLDALKSPFTNAAIKTLESIRELERFIAKRRKDYVDLHRTTEQERDNIEHDINILKNRIQEEAKTGRAKTWLDTRDESSWLNLIAHQHGVVLILSERLHSVTAQFDHIRSMRFQDAINRAMPRKNIQKKPEIKPAEPSKSNLVLKSDVSKAGDQEVSTAPIRVQEQLLDDETRVFQVELTNLDAVQETETKIMDMSALNHLVSTRVLQQAQQIQCVYDQAVEATNNVERGSKELSRAIQRNSSSTRTFLLLFFFVLTFSVLFLD